MSNTPFKNSPIALSPSGEKTDLRVIGRTAGGSTIVWSETKGISEIPWEVHAVWPTPWQGRTDLPVPTASVK